MNAIDLLILDGPPAVGKSSLADAIASVLQEHEIPHAIIDLDDIARVYPPSYIGIMYINLAAIWPNYEAMGTVKIIIPTYMQLGEREMVMEAAPAERTTICEVIVPTEESARRIAEREPSETNRKRLLEYLEGYPTNKTPAEQVDFTISNHGRRVEETANAIIEKLNWLA